MRNHRGILTILLAVALLTTGITIAVFAFLPRLPDPAVADRDGLLQWLVARDLGGESPATREVLVCRLDEEFRSGIDWEATGKRLDGDQRKRVCENVLLLMGPWLKQKTDRYFALPETERTAFLDETVDSIAMWRGVESFRPDPSANNANRESNTRVGGLPATLLNRADEYDGRANPARRQQIDRFVQAVQARWLMRSLGELSPVAQ